MYTITFSANVSVFELVTFSFCGIEYGWFKGRYPLGRHFPQLIATVFMSCTTVCFAAGASAAVNNPGRQLLEQTQRGAVPGPGQALAPQAERAPGAANPHELKFAIRKIEILGVTRLSREEVRQLASRYENRALGVSDINVLMEAITRAYVKRGYITTRVYLPEQNIRGGTLKLKVIEGRLGSFSTSTVKRSQIATAFPTRPGRIIRLPDLEQGMDQLERATSEHLKIELLPGSKEGTSIVALSFSQHVSGSSRIRSRQSRKPNNRGMALACGKRRR